MTLHKFHQKHALNNRHCPTHLSLLAVPGILLDQEIHVTLVDQQVLEIQLVHLVRQVQCLLVIPLDLEDLCLHLNPRGRKAQLHPLARMALGIQHYLQHRTKTTFYYGYSSDILKTVFLHVLILLHPLIVLVH